MTLFPVFFDEYTGDPIEQPIGIAVWICELNNMDQHGYPSKIQCSTSFWINMASDVFFRDVAHVQTSPCVNPWARRSVKVPYYWDPSCNSNRVSLGCWADARSLGVLGQGMARGRDPWMVSKVTTVNTSLIVETTLVGGLEHVFFHILGIIIPTDFHVFQRGGSTTNQYRSP